MRLLAIGDIHGERAAAEQAVELADREQRRIVLLGDLTDRGPDSAGTLALLVPRVLSGKAIWIRGNHDDKLARALAGNSVTLNHGLDGTMAEIDARADRDDFVSLVNRGLAQTRYWWSMPPYFFVHGAFAPDMLCHDDLHDVRSRKGVTRMRHDALYGETTGDRTSQGFPVRTYRWLERLPAGLAVIVGHDARDFTNPVTERSPAGGRVIFLDTGAGKGGCLSALRLPEESLVQFACETAPKADSA